VVLRLIYVDGLVVLLVVSYFGFVYAWGAFSSVSQAAVWRYLILVYESRVQ
jgi:hypothetical protein